MCSNGRMKAEEFSFNAHSLSSSASGGEEIQDSVESTKTLSSLNKSLRGIGESPVKLHSLPSHCKTPYEKRKLTKISDTNVDLSTTSHQSERLTEDDTKSLNTVLFKTNKKKSPW